MNKRRITLYVNDPMGKRWIQNMQAAGQVADEYGAEIVVIKKTSEEYGREENPPPCPSVAVDGNFVVQNGTVTYEDLKKAVGENT